ncbi:MAG: flagellar basal-body MS-ring/collar protein FliF [bacterium]
MAEGVSPVPEGGQSGRQIIIIATVVTVVFFTFFIMGLRSCSTLTEQGTAKSKPSSHVVIYSNMSLKDSALVIARLKELKIQYQIKDEGRSIAVARGQADEARLGLAEKNLPSGGSVGWEIFDQSRLGATDFDRRIQFIRAISGELSRTINRIGAIEDARVQIVIPETKLFEVSKAPVTASVLIKMKPGETLIPKQVNGIMYLVAGSVENLKPENITIIDTNGNIWGGGEYALAAPREVTSTPKAEMRPEVVIEKEEEKNALEVQAKLDLENALTSRVQSLLNKLYPPNITIARVNIDSMKTRKTTIIILVDKTYKITQDLKKSTFETISAAAGYDKTRGDKIIMKSVPFRSAGTVPIPAVTRKGTSAAITLSALKAIYRKYGKESAIAIIVLFLLVLFLIFRLFRKGKKEDLAEAPREEEAAMEAEEDRVPIVDHMKDLASQNPEFAAELIRSWVEQEEA